METANKSLREQTQQLLDGPLKHIRGAALAAALLPLASVVPAAASVDPVCGSGGVCGTVFNDTNGNGVRDLGEPGIESPMIFCEICDGTDNVESSADASGAYKFFAVEGT